MTHRAESAYSAHQALYADEREGYPSNGLTIGTTGVCG
jgi:hypothetical protein